MLWKNPEGPGRSQPCMAGNGPLGVGLEDGTLWVKGGIVDEVHK